MAVLMTPTEKAAYTDRAHNLGLSLGQFSVWMERPTPTATPAPTPAPSRKRKPVKITADTNVLVRALVQDDPDQASLRTGRPAVRAGGTPP